MINYPEAFAPALEYLDLATQAYLFYWDQARNCSPDWLPKNWIADKSNQQHLIDQMRLQVPGNFSDFHIVQVYHIVSSPEYGIWEDDQIDAILWPDK